MNWGRGGARFPIVSNLYYFDFEPCELLSVTAVPNLFGTRDRFLGRQFFHGRGGRAGEDGSGGSASDGGQQMKLRSLACRSPPVWPGS